MVALLNLTARGYAAAMLAGSLYAKAEATTDEAEAERLYGEASAQDAIARRELGIRSKEPGKLSCYGDLVDDFGF
jgi:hypothetical protein